MSVHKPEDKRRYLDDPENVRKLWRFFIIACVAVASIDLLGLLEIVYHRHVSLFAEGLPGFYAIWGFVGIALLIFLAKQLRKVVMRPEDYYDEARDDGQAIETGGAPGKETGDAD